MKEEIIEVMKAEAPLNWAKANEIAARFDVKARSIVASATSNDIPYERKKRVSKSGAPVLRKSDLAVKIGAITGLDMAGLEGAKKETLVALAEYLEAK